MDPSSIDSATPTGRARPAAPGSPAQGPGIPQLKPSTARLLALVGLFGLLSFVVSLILLLIGAVARIEILKSIGALLLLIALGCIFAMAGPLRRLRAKQLPAVVRALGLSLSEKDPFDLASANLPFAQFGLRGSEFRNVVWGTYQGVELKGFDHRFEVEGDHGTHETAWRFMALAELPANCPPLEMSRGPGVTPTKEMPRVTFESEQFNREVTVACADARFATALVDELMMAWILDAGSTDVEVELSGPFVLVRKPEAQEIGDMVQTLNACTQFVQHVPRVVSSLYPAVDAGA